jgi:hypothetical protein
MCIYLDGEVTNLFLTKITAKVPPLLVKLSVLIRIFRGRGPTPSHPLVRRGLYTLKGIQSQDSEICKFGIGNKQKSHTVFGVYALFAKRTNAVTYS